MPSSIQAATVAVPLLFVVVTELSAASREMDLKDIADNDGYLPSLFTFLPDWFLFPELGRFNFIHGMNTVLLGFGIAMASFFLEGEEFLRITLIFVIWLGWVILPALEVSDYDSIFGKRPPKLHSVHIHFVGTLIGGMFAFFFPSIVVYVSGSILPSLGLLCISVIAAYVVYVPYMMQLQSELGDNCTSINHIRNFY